MIMLKVLTQYQEATGDARVIPVMEKYFAYQSRVLAGEPLKDWAVYRWQDELASVLWLYNRDGDPHLLDLARQLKGQGFDWEKMFDNFPFPGKVSRERAQYDSHGVNNAMGMKTAALWQLISHDSNDRDATARMLHALDEFQGLPNGMFSADEHFAGRNPSQGTELCTVGRGHVLAGTRPRGARRSPVGRPAGEDRPTIRCPGDNRPTSGRINTISSRTRCYVRWGAATGSPTARSRTSSGLSRISAAAPPICIRAGRNSRRRCGWRRADDGLALAAYGPSQVRTSVKGVGCGRRRGPRIIRFAIAYRWRLRRPRSAIPLYVRIPEWAAEGDRVGQRTKGGRGAHGFVSTNRTRMAEGRSRGYRTADEGADDRRVQRIDFGGARAAGIFARDRRELEQAEADRTGDRLTRSIPPRHGITVCAWMRRIPRHRFK